MRTWVGMVAALAGLASVQCNTADSTQCASGIVCPASLVCSPNGTSCIDPFALAACEGVEELGPCTTEEDGICRSGICVPIECGNGLTDPGEECDCGEEDELAAGCTMPNSDEAGALCKTDCFLHCGDGIANSAEQCDGADLGSGSCLGFNFDAGHLSCDAQCRFDSGECLDYGFAPLPFESISIPFRATGPELYVPTNGVAKFDGSFWIVEPSPLLLPLHGAGFRDGEVFVVGAETLLSQGTMGLTVNTGSGWEFVACGEAGQPLCEEPYYRAQAGDDYLITTSISGVQIFDGTTWMSIEGGLFTGPMWAASTDDIYATTPTAFRHWNGTQWQDLPDPGRPDGLWGRSSTEIYHSSDRVRRFNGSTWQEEPLVVGLQYAAVTGNDDVVFVARRNPALDENRIYYKDDLGWSWFDGPFLSTADAGADGRILAAEAGSEAVYFGGTGLRSADTTPGNRSLAAAGERDAMIGRNGEVLLFDGEQWTPRAVPSCQVASCLITNMYAAGPGDYFFTMQTDTQAFEVLRFVNDSFSVVSTITDFSPTAIDGIGSDELVIVGVDLLADPFVAYAKFFRNGTWGPDTPIAAESGASLRDAWMAGDSTVVGVGDDGLVLRWDGSQWSQIQSGVTTQLSSVWGSAPDDVWIAGPDEGILHYDGVAVNRAPFSFAAPAFFAVRGSGPDDVVAISPLQVAHFDGVRWEPATMPPRIIAAVDLAVLPRSVFVMSSAKSSQLVRFRPW